MLRQMKIIFIRHGQTNGNLQKRYIGRTDESLSETGIAEIKKHSYPAADIIITSPMKRCIETAKLIYPDSKITSEIDFRECDFGSFEGKNYTELSGDPDYQKWIDSGGKTAFPNGESLSDFRRRCCLAFLRSVKNIPENSNVAMIVHGGTIMSVISRFAVPEREYFDCQVGNGCGFLTFWDGKKITVISELNYETF